MNIEVSATVKLAAITFAVLVLIGPSVWKFIVDVITPFHVPRVDDTPKQDLSEVDAAVRVLLDNAKQRECRKSIQLLNSWIELRNLSLVPSNEV